VHVLFSVTFFQKKKCSPWDNVEKRGSTREATNHKITGRRQDAIRMPDNEDKTADPHSFKAYYCQQQFEILYGPTRV
jgi:hypothetical protein